MNERSEPPISRNDLKRLARLALEEREDFFGRHPEWSMLYRKRVVSSALCGEAALHFVNGSSGFSEFRVWTFYAEHDEAPYPHNRVGHRDFGESKFGRAADRPAYRGRRVELNARSLHCTPIDDPIEVLQHYLRRGQTPTARELRRQAVVLIEPGNVLGYVVWPTLVVSNGK